MKVFKRNLAVGVFLILLMSFGTYASDRKPQGLEISCEDIIRLMQQSGYTNEQIKDRLHISQGGQDCSKELRNL